MKKHIWDTKRVVWYRDSFWVQIDLGIEKSGRIWTIEVNSKPDHMLFARLQTNLRCVKLRKTNVYLSQSILNTNGEELWLKAIFKQLRPPKVISTNVFPDNKKRKKS